MAEKTMKTNMSTYVTGFCNNGGHEGAQVLSVKGALLRSCSGEFTINGRPISCNCDCHEAFRQIAALTGLTTKGALISPVLLDPIATKENATPVDVPAGGDTPDTATVEAQDTLPIAPMSGVSSSPPVLAPPTLAPIPAQPIEGRRAKGELETSVTKLLGEWFPNPQGKSITPKEISHLMSGGQASLGAIHAIIKRLEKSGRATVAEKPFRVVTFR